MNNKDKTYQDGLNDALDITKEAFRLISTVISPVGCGGKKAAESILHFVQGMLIGAIINNKEENNNE
jgi:hypothetical protein